MFISSTLVTRFLNLIRNRRFADAERAFKQLSNKLEKNEWHKGYLQALYGMLLTQRMNDDRYAFFSNININSKDELKKYRSDFSKYAKSQLYREYDSGFFSAWADYISILLKIKPEKAER